MKTLKRSRKHTKQPAGPAAPGLVRGAFADLFEAFLAEIGRTGL